jgi:protein O-GlcNAc transferase
LKSQGDAVSDGETLRAALQHQRSGRLDDAEQRYRQLLERNPRDVNALHLLGTVQLQRGSAGEAVRYIRQAVALRPDFAMAHANLGVALRSAGDLPGAIESYDRALGLNPSDAATWLNLSTALSGLGRFTDALAASERALSLNPREPQARVGRANLLLRLLRFEEAVEAFEQALQLRPTDATLHLACAQIFSRGGRPAQALEAYRRARELSPELQLPAGGLVFMRMQLCEWSERAADMELARSHDAQAPVSPLAMLGLFDEPDLHLSTAMRWGVRLHTDVPAEVLAEERARTREPRPNLHLATRRRLRLGYLSADFRDHIVTHAIVKLLEQHDRDAFAPTALSLSSDDGSSARARLLGAMETSVDLSGLSDTEAALTIREHGVDILIDLGGYSADARPGILLHRPAPVQASYLGYPATLGIAGVDYLICDRHVIPEESEQHYREALARLPECFMPYDTSRTVATTTPSRSQEQLPESALVLCSFNASWKIHPLVFEIWMRLLVQLPNSVLWLRDGEGVPDNLRREAAARGVSAERLIFARREPDAAVHLARQALADLFLDTWPYNAHQTACDALWAGLPVLTCSGRSFPSRVAGSLLRTAGVPELVCESLEHYERRALELARDPAQLQKLRERIRAARVTPLFDMPRLCRHLEEAYRQMWQCHERGEPPRGFSVSARPRGPDHQ